jgi:hypothetical protein
MRVQNCYRVVWVCAACVSGGFLCGMEHGVRRKAMLMRGGACVDELRFNGSGGRDRLWVSWLGVVIVFIMGFLLIFVFGGGSLVVKSRSEGVGVVGSLGCCV